MMTIVALVISILLAGAYVDYAERRRKKQEQIEKMYRKAIVWLRRKGEYEVDSERPSS